MRKSTIKLTKKEFDFITSREYPKIKRLVIQKICQRFDELGTLFKQNLVATNETERKELDNAHFKTTRGENYQALPFVVLDYPRIRGNDFVLLCRTMFWWGKYVSLNVIVRSDAFDMKTFARELKKSSLKKVKLYSGKDIWQQNLSDKHFIKVSKLSEDDLAALLRKQIHNKFSIRVSFKHLEELEERAINFYNTILSFQA